MNDIRKELLEIIADVRAHLEFRKLLGTRGIAVLPPERDRPAFFPSAGPASQEPDPSTLLSGTASRMAMSPSGKSLPACESLEEIRKEIGDCKRCKLHRGRKNIVFGEGDEKTSIVFIGEGPGFEEDQQGRPFVGAAGQLLTDIIEKGMKIRRAEVYICNIVKCRPPDNRNPEPDEVEACIGFVRQQIAVIRPKVIVTLGNVPTQNLLGTKQGITKMRGIPSFLSS
jgi:uracil-DNA glycosylase family 4